MTDERKDWLAVKRLTVGASDVANILNIEGAFGTRLSTYNSKVLGEELKPTDQMLMGLACEQGIADLYVKHTGRAVRNPGPYTIRRHRSAPLGATLDRYITGPDFRGPLELKMVGRAMSHKWGDEPPLAYQVQVQAQMACSGDATAVLCGWVGGDTLVHYEIERDEAFIAAMLVAVIAFWGAHVERRIPPEPGGTAVDARALQKLYPKDAGSTIALSDTALALADLRDELTGQIKQAEAAKDLASNKLKAALGEATYGVLPDGTRMSWKLQKRKEHIVAASESRVLRRLKAPGGKR